MVGVILRLSCSLWYLVDPARQTIVVPPELGYGEVCRLPCGYPRLMRSFAILAALALFSANPMSLPLSVNPAPIG